MFAQLATLMVRRAAWVIAAWLLTLVALRLGAPAWNQVTHDGDLAYLPASMPSVRGERLASAAFPQTRGKSQIAVIFSRDNKKLTLGDLRVADRAAARFFLELGLGWLEDWIQARQPSRRTSQSTSLPGRSTADILAALDEALRLDDGFSDAERARAIAVSVLGTDKSQTEDTDAPELRRADREWLLAQAASRLPLVDVWSRHTDVVGGKLRSGDGRAVLILLHLGNEFMATDNVRVMNLMDQEVDRIQRDAFAASPGLRVGVSGSASVGGDMLRAAAASIRHTEIMTIAIVVVILLVVYRAPLLALVPILAIAVSLMVATSLTAAFTQLHLVPGFSWWDFKIFKTTRIFVVVILYGSGTDFCLFLVSRYREFLQQGESPSGALARSVRAVGPSITASAATTILGLAMMAFAQFGKFRHSGPAIGLCLAVTLVACLTLAPALIAVLGRQLWWPWGLPSPARSNSGLDRDSASPVVWQGVARLVVSHPAPLLVLSLILMGPLAWHGFQSENRVTYDLLSELDASWPSKRGTELLERHFPVGEGGPLIIVARHPRAEFLSEDRTTSSTHLAAVFELTTLLDGLPGVSSVRSWAEPVGDHPRRLSLLTSAGRRKLALQQHRLTKAIYLSSTPPFAGTTTRLEAVLHDHPFSAQAAQTVSRIESALAELAHNRESFWYGGEFEIAGTVAGLRDLRAVTQSDHRRIELLVVAAVFVVLLILLRRVTISLFMISSVVLTYAVTIGATDLLFRWSDGPAFPGLDWKTPLFLFVILVAVGVDYNIYLVTRVFDEQRRWGPLPGIEEAMIRTGGIITSCGVIMAGTFVSMLGSSLRGMVELGFALALGILLDTFLVRTVLVGACLSLLQSREKRGQTR